MCLLQKKFANPWFQLEGGTGLLCFILVIFTLYFFVCHIPVRLCWCSQLDGCPNTVKPKNWYHLGFTQSRPELWSICHWYFFKAIVPFLMHYCIYSLMFGHLWFLYAHEEQNNTCSEIKDGLNEKQLELRDPFSQEEVLMNTLLVNKNQLPQYSRGVLILLRSNTPTILILHADSSEQANVFDIYNLPVIWYHEVKIL